MSEQLLAALARFDSGELTRQDVDVLLAEQDTLEAAGADAGVCELNRTAIRAQWQAVQRRRQYAGQSNLLST